MQKPFHCLTAVDTRINDFTAQNITACVSTG